MKYFFLTIIILIQLIATAQSPYLSIQLKMDSLKAKNTRYKIEMKICEPKKMAERGDWFTNDTSTIDFVSLKSNDINCGKYFDKGMSDPLGYNQEEFPVNKFEFSNQVFAWEKIFVFRVSDWSSRALHPEMYIVMPMKYKSFITYIKLNELEFQSGKVIFLLDYNKEQKKMHLTIDQSLKNHKIIGIEDLPFKEILEKD